MIEKEKTKSIILHCLFVLSYRPNPRKAVRRNKRCVYYSKFDIDTLIILIKG